MKIKSMLLGLAVIVMACARATWPQPAPLENDRSVALPQFFSAPAIQLGAEATPYELDGVVLKAIMVATNDFLRPGSEKPTCWGSPEAHRYRVIRKENIIFVRIDEDLGFCGLQYVSVDTGAEYAISIDGRILRRIIDGEPESFRGAAPTAPDAGVQVLTDAPSANTSPPDAGSQVPDAGPQDEP
jgi:hypothetical protein